MPPILGSNLQDKSVMTSDGKMLGQLHNITMDTTSGELIHLVVQPDGELEYDNRYTVNEEGHYLVPARQVQGVKDYITVHN